MPTPIPLAGQTTWRGLRLWILHTLRCAMFVLLVFSMIPGHVWAGSGSTYLRNGNGYTVKIDTQWADGYGYRPIRFVITPNVVPVTDETLTIRLSTETMFSNSVAVEQQVVIPAQTVNGGSAAAEAIVRMPVYDGWDQLQLEITRNGRPLRQLSTPISFDMPLGRNNWFSGRATVNTGTDQSVLFIDSAVRLRAGSVTVAPGGQPTSPAIKIGPDGAPVWVLPGNTNPNFTSVHPGELSDSWLDFTPVDVIALSLDELQSMKSQFPDQFQAVRAWAFSGGSLWVFFGTNADLSDLSEINEALRLSGDDVTDAEHGWRTTAPLNTGALTYIDLDTRPSGLPPVSDESPLVTSSDRLTSQLRWRPFGLGTLAAIPAPDQTADSDWNVVSTELKPLAQTWTTRHGLSPNSRNSDFWNFLIPGVGMPPVVMFEILITLFVVVIGPVNYLFLRKRRRLHLLVITVPVMALLVTAGLFAYALASDGLHVRVMPRSFTYLDQRQNHAACWSRLSYYAGLAPSGGLKFADNVAVYPIPGIVHEWPDANQRTREVRWEDGQNLQTGWLDSRTPMQLMTIRSRTSNYQLVVTESVDGSPTVQNLLGSPVRHLLLADSEGQQYVAADIALEGTATLDALTSASQQLEPLRKAIRSSMPAQVDPPRQRTFFWGGPVEDADIQLGLLEQHMDAASSLSGGATSLPSRSYLAIVEKSPECQFGHDGAVQVSGFHVIYGRW
ncbi:MAG: hypothetical protein MPJ50_04745 [Pirellulales bacterium]|nr:hypothetical protein [Pirellulales bacterium]